MSEENVAIVRGSSYVVLTFRDGKISSYREFYDEESARASLR